MPWLITIFMAILLVFGVYSWLSNSKTASINTASVIQGELANQVIAAIQANLSWPRFDITYITKSTALNNYLTNPSEITRNQLESSLSQLQETRPHLYAQIRYLDLNGQEIIRVERGGKRIVAADQLQNKSHRYYVQDAMLLAPGQIGMSPMDLNIEHNEIEQPLNPMLRFYTRVIDRNGNVRGILVINYRASTLLKTLDAMHSDIPFWWLNEEGYWFRGVPESQRWGFMYSEKQDQTLMQSDPQLWQLMQTMIAEGSTHKSLPSGLLYVRSIPLDFGAAIKDDKPTVQWILASLIPKAGTWTQVLLDNQFLLSASFVIYILFSVLIFKTVSVAKRYQELDDLRLLTEQETRQKTRFEAIFQSSPAALIIVDGNGIIRQVNQFAKSLFGYTADSMQDMPVSELIPTSYRERHSDLMHKYQQNSYAMSIQSAREIFARKADGSNLSVEIRLTPFMLDDQQVTLATIMDISERKRLLKELQDSLLQLNNVNFRLEARVAERTRQLQVSNRELESFAYAVSHDLRAPLRSLDGFSKLLLLRYSESLDDRGIDFLNRIRGASQHMGRLIDDMLTLSRISRQELVIEDVALSVLAKAIVEELQAAEPQRQVLINIDPKLEVACDKRLIQALLINLLGNSWKYTAKSPQAQIDFFCEDVGDYRWFVVKDNGAGFDMKFIDKIFKPFQRLHHETEFPGNGIGLSTVVRVIEKHNGEIVAHGEVDVGAEFRFRLGVVESTITHKQEVQ